MKHLFARLRSAAAAAALMVAASIGTNMAFTAPAHAESGMQDEHEEIRRAFADFDFVPGKRWYRLTGPRTELPATVVRDVEMQLGVLLCKRQNVRGEWESNLKICPANHPQMMDPVIGALNPRRDRDGPILDYITQNYAYDMPTRMSDLPIARAVNTVVLAQREHNSGIQLASADTAVPESVVVADARPVPRTPRIQTRTPRVVPVPVPRPVELGTPAATVVAAAEERPADPAPVAVAAVEERAVPAAVAEQPAPVALAQADAVASPVTGGDVVATQLAALDIPVRRVRTVRITLDRPAVEQPVAVATAEQPAPVQVAAAAPAVTPVVERAVLTASNDAPVRDVFAAFAANDTRSPIQRMLDLRNARLQGELKNTPQPANDDHDRSSKAPFNVAVLNETPRLPGGGAPARGWVTPAGRKMGFHVYENGRFRPAPQLMAA